MKAKQWLIALVAIAAAGLVGCGKPKLQQSQEVEGQSIDMPKLQQAFATSTNQEASQLVSQASYGLRYADYMKSMMALEQLINRPDITPEQKKIAEDVMAQVKKVAGTPAPGTAPAQ
jgi:hypothetical protein